MTNVKLYHRRMPVKGNVVYLRMECLFCLFVTCILQCFMSHEMLNSQRN